jgi:hypothetical protein
MIYPKYIVNIDGSRGHNLKGVACIGEDGVKDIEIDLIIKSDSDVWSPGVTLTREKWEELKAAVDKEFDVQAIVLEDGTELRPLAAEVEDATFYPVDMTVVKPEKVKRGH